MAISSVRLSIDKNFPKATNHFQGQPSFSKTFNALNLLHHLNSSTFKDFQFKDQRVPWVAHTKKQQMTRCCCARQSWLPMWQSSLLDCKAPPTQAVRHNSLVAGICSSAANHYMNIHTRHQMHMSNVVIKY